VAYEKARAKGWQFKVFFELPLRWKADLAERLQPAYFVEKLLGNIAAAQS
jgi:hypothetical protein